jgi:copper resistance protein B
MSTRSKSMASAQRRSARAIVGIAFAACAVLHARAQPAPGPVGLPAHEMLEDPFNRSVLFDELEVHGSDDLRWDASLWAGRTFDRLAVRSEGERTGGVTERAEMQLLWTHAVARWWDVVAGARADFEPGPSRNWAAFGVQGLAPYRFEVGATLFVGDGGDTAARIEGEYELLIARRLILQPRIELDWHGRADAERAIGSGLSSVEAGVRLRYELRREVAPYVGLVRERRFGGTADYARAARLDPDDSSLVLGVRLRF